MSEWVEFTAKTVDEALTEALMKLNTNSENIEYEILVKETNGILGLFSKPAKIQVKLKFQVKDVVQKFIEDVIRLMEVDAKIDIDYNEEDSLISINILGDNMGVLIGKRGQTLDSLQYLASLVANKESDKYVKIKLDTENYRERRKETVENLAKNIAHKVKRTKKTSYLEPMNPYERRIIHSTLQNDKYVETHSEGEEPNRRVVVTLKKEYREYNRKSNYNKNNYYKKDKENKTFAKE